MVKITSSILYPSWKLIFLPKSHLLVGETKFPGGIQDRSIYFHHERRHPSNSSFWDGKEFCTYNDRRVCLIYVKMRNFVPHILSKENKKLFFVYFNQVANLNEARARINTEKRY